MVQVIVAVVDAVLDAIDEMTGAVLSAVTVTELDVAKLLDVSRATAKIVLLPEVVAVESHTIE